MDFRSALDQICGADGALSDEQKRHFDEQGYVILPNVFSPEQCRRFAAEFDRLSAIEGAEGGKEVHTEAGAPRVSNVFNKTDVFDVCLRSGPILHAAYHLLGDLKLHGANMRNPLKGQGHQNLHSDAPKESQRDWRVANALIPFDDMDRTNGATRVVPGSHLWPALTSPDSPVTMQLTEAEQSMLPKDRAARHPRQIEVELRAGDVVVINGALWHGGTLNESGRNRRMLHLSFTRRDLPQQLVQQDYLTPGFQQRLTPALHYLLDTHPLSSAA
ncbi:MAG: phytanoyl-CoA dioxygenase family protein [Bosea sp.]|nr:phytanoyl-CoA dioxygenase family protein [Bosea sp. (in: a-proteobacteria)]